MPKLLISPYDADERLVTRAQVRIDDQSTPEQILQKMGDAFRCGGVTRVVKINVTDQTGETTHQTWSINDAPLPAAIVKEEPPPIETSNEETTDMPAVHSSNGTTKKPQVKMTKPKAAKVAKPPKAAKVAKPKAAKVAKPKAAKVAKKNTKLDALVELMKRASGVSAKEASDKLAWNGVSVSKWAKIAKVKFTKEKDKDGVTRYYAS